MDAILDAPLDITIGPYATGNDELCRVQGCIRCLRNDPRRFCEIDPSEECFPDHLLQTENNLPIEARYRNPGSWSLSAPICVVNEANATGDGAHGVRTASVRPAPTDDRVVQQKGVCA